MLVRHPAAGSNDPLTQVMLPPPDETPEQRAVRLQREAEAQRVSEAIDNTLKQERQLQKKKKFVKLLLLGQCESVVRPRPRRPLTSALTGPAAAVIRQIDNHAE